MYICHCVLCVCVCECVSINVLNRNRKNKRMVPEAAMVNFCSIYPTDFDLLLPKKKFEIEAVRACTFMGIVYFAFVFLK